MLKINFGTDMKQPETGKFKIFYLRQTLLLL